MHNGHRVNKIPIIPQTVEDVHIRYTHTKKQVGQHGATKHRLEKSFQFIDNYTTDFQNDVTMSWNKNWLIQDIQDIHIYLLLQIAG